MYPSTLEICHISSGEFLLLFLWELRSPLGRTAQTRLGREISFLCWQPVIQSAEQRVS